MTIVEKINAINAIVKKQSWYDFEVQDLKGNNLTVIGSLDFSNNHTLEITFTDVFHMSLNTSWSSDTSEKVLLLAEGEEARKINLKFRIEQGNFLFRFIPEDFGEDTGFYIAAKDLSFNTDTVYYYKKDDLKAGERIADWVK